MTFTPENIIWIKHSTNNTGPHAYMDEVDEFTLHVPTRKKNAALTPGIDDLILVYQKIHGIPCFTHLVSPVSERIEEGGVEGFEFGRKVKIIAITEGHSAIPRNLTSWANVNFRGVGHGNFCNVANIKDIQNIPALQQEIWERFRPFFTDNSEEIRKAAEVEVERDAEENETKEGKKKLVKHYLAERDRKIVNQKKAKAIKNGTLHCECCAFSFQTKFQKDFIECHHIDPIGSKGERTTILDDLALVCPNCHRMLHLKFEGKYLSIEELRNRFYPQ